jgi:uncharacterized protein YjbI with pentapeptide repeats
LWIEKESKNISNLYDLKNILADNKTLEKHDYIYKSFTEKSLLDIYRKLIDIDDNELFTFLRVSKEALLRIDSIEKYLMVSDPIGMTNKVGTLLDIDSRKQSNLIHNKLVTEFNKYFSGIPIHLPFEKLSGCELHDFSLSFSLLFMSDLSGAKLLDTILINCTFSDVIVDTDTDFSNAVIDNPDFLKHLHKKGSRNIPNEINNKQELRRELLKRDLDPKTSDLYLGSSELPES